MMLILPIIKLKATRIGLCSDGAQLYCYCDILNTTGMNRGYSEKGV